MSARHATLATAAAALAAAALATAAQAAPKVQQLVAFRDGGAAQKRVTARAATARLGSRRCAVGTATPLAALIRSDVGALRLRDYGSCSDRPADAAGLYVAAIRGDRARGSNGWVYKVGNRVGTAGAADPQGPFGRGRLRSGARVTWFYCRMSARTGSCQRTLRIASMTADGDRLRVTVRAHDDSGRGRPAAGVTVHAGDATATTGSSGTAELPLPAGGTPVWATKEGLVRSFREAYRGA